MATVEIERIAGEDDSGLILNLGPQHPSTHGVLRVVLKMDGEYIKEAVPIIGYLHRGTEKIAESETYTQILGYTDRMDYTAAASSNLGWLVAVEALAEIEVPERAQWLRCIVGELGRLAGHLVWIGTVCGKLMMMDASFQIPDQQVVDSTGIYFTPMLRHFDRGCLESDNGNFRSYEFVFGATAAAACYRREMIEDVAVEGEFFDPDFFTYREDADVAWRAQLLGWKCIYVPHAFGYHVRKLRPGMRRMLPPEINMHSVKNRFLMRMKNITAGVYLRNAVPITVRDLGILFYCLLVERSSLRAFYMLARDWDHVMRKRRLIQSRRRVEDAYMVQWFRFSPVSLPIEVRDEVPAPPVPVARS